MQNFGKLEIMDEKEMVKESRANRRFTSWSLLLVFMLVSGASLQQIVFLPASVVEIKSDLKPLRDSVTVLTNKVAFLAFENTELKGELKEMKKKQDMILLSVSANTLASSFIKETLIDIKNSIRSIQTNTNN